MKLKHRATRCRSIITHTNSKSQSNKSWPHFSLYLCCSCHRGFTVTSRKHLILPCWLEMCSFRHSLWRVHRPVRAHKHKFHGRLNVWRQLFLTNRLSVITYYRSWWLISVRNFWKAKIRFLQHKQAGCWTYGLLGILETMMHCSLWIEKL